MSGQSLKCAYCGVALPVAFYGVDAWRVGNDSFATSFVRTVYHRQSVT